MKKSQTASEYLVILSIAIVIAIVVINVLGSGISLGKDREVNNLELQNQKVGILQYASTISKTVLFIQNNENELIRVTNITMGNQSCESVALPATLNLGEKKRIVCSNIKGTSQGEYFRLETDIEYQSMRSLATYTIPDLILEGEISLLSGENCFDPESNPVTLCSCEDLTRIQEYPHKNYELLNDIDCSESQTYNGNETIGYQGFITFGAYTSGYCSDNRCSNKATCEASIGCDYYDENPWYTTEGCTNSYDWACEYNQTVCESGICGGTWNESGGWCDGYNGSANGCAFSQTVCEDWCGSWVSPNNCFDQYQWEISNVCTTENQCNADYGCASSWNDATDTRFTGTFDGNNREISNIFINSTGDAGLFGRTYQATFRDLIIRNANVTGGDYTAIIAARPDQTNFINIVIQDSVVTGEDYVGTLAGYQSGSSSNYVDYSNIQLNGVTVTGDQYVGGIGGRVQYVNVQDVLVQSTYVSGTNRYIGTAFGYTYYGSLDDSTIEANSTATDSNSMYIGGVTGYSNRFDYDKISVTGTISNDGNNGCTSTGGISGFLSNSIVNRSTFTGELSSAGATNGGIAGYSSGSLAIIENNIVIANLTGGRSATRCAGFGTSDILTGGIVGLKGSPSSKNYFVGNLYNPENGGTNGGLAGFTFNSYTYTRYSFANGSVYGGSTRNGETSRFNYWGSTSTGLYYDAGYCLYCSIGTGIDTIATPNYFFNSSNPPMDQWDFENIWQENNNTYPTLRW